MTRIEPDEKRAVVFVVAPGDLVISKLDWARDTRSEVQLADVRNLLDALYRPGYPLLEIVSPEEFFR